MLPLVIFTAEENAAPALTRPRFHQVKAEADCEIHKKTRKAKSTQDSEIQPTLTEGEAKL
jgi:hypothetical protein